MAMHRHICVSCGEQHIHFGDKCTLAEWMALREHQSNHATKGAPQAFHEVVEPVPTVVGEA